MSAFVSQIDRWLSSCMISTWTACSSSKRQMLIRLSLAASVLTTGKFNAMDASECHRSSEAIC